MPVSDFFISPEALWDRIGQADAEIDDVRRLEVFESSAGMIPASRWQEPKHDADWLDACNSGKPVVIVCRQGHELSQSVAAELRSRGIDARVLAGGYAAWEQAGLPLVARKAYDRFITRVPSLWVTRRRPKIDRVACPWLIRRFIDPAARFLFVDPPEVPAVARETGAIPFDIEGVELSHIGDRCSFDTLLDLFGLDQDPALAQLALIVRGADTAAPQLAAEAAGLLAVSLGLSALAGDDDHGLLRQGFVVYDALYAWRRKAASETHNWPARVA